MSVEFKNIECDGLELGAKLVPWFRQLLLEYLNIDVIYATSHGQFASLQSVDSKMCRHFVIRNPYDY